MNPTSRSTSIRRHLRRDTVVLWTAYCSGLVIAMVLGLSIFALATQHYVAGLCGLGATVFGGVAAAILVIRTRDTGDPINQALLRRARHEGYLRNIESS